MWKLIRTSVIGTAHTRDGTQCQDASSSGEFEIAGARCLVAAIADGAGCAKESGLGAEIAVQAIIDSITSHATPLNQVQRHHAYEWIVSVRARLQLKADEMGLELRDLACTLLACCIADSHAVFVQIGDGAWIAEVDGKLQVVVWPDSGEYVNETVFVTSSASLDTFSFCTLPSRITALAGFSDGLQRLALNYGDRTPHEGFFRPMFDTLVSTDDPGSLVAPLIAFLASPSVNDRTDDDKTLLLALPAKPE